MHTSDEDKVDPNGPDHSHTIISKAVQCNHP